MAKIEFRGKVERVHNMDDTLAYEMIKIPKLERRHCDMPAFRQHSKFGGLANSDLFPNILKRIASDLGGNGYLRLDRIPANVTVDRSGFLAKVEIEA